MTNVGDATEPGEPHHPPSVRNHLSQALLLVLAFVVLVARRPEALARPTFWNEDGPIFFAGALAGVPVWTPVQGYLTIIPRLVATLETVVPWPALSGNVIALSVTVAVAAFIASDRMALAIPEPRARLLAAAALLVLPAVDEVLGSVTYIQWWLALYLILGIAASEPSGRWRSLEGVSLALASVTGPFSIFVAPFYWLRRDRTFAAIVSAGAVAQIVTLLSASRTGRVHIPDELISIIAGRMVIEPVVGANLLPAVPLVFAAILIVPIGLCLRRLPVPVLLAGGLVTAAGIVLSPETTRELQDPYGAQRYFFVVGALIAIATAVSAYRREPAGILLAVLAVGMVADFRLVPH